MWQNCKSSVGKFHTEFQSASENTISTRTVGWKLDKLGFYGQKAAHKLNITKITASHLKWCREWHHWTPEQWRQVLWSDESLFTIWHNLMKGSGHGGSQVNATILSMYTNCEVWWRRHHGMSCFSWYGLAKGCWIWNNSRQFCAFQIKGTVQRETPFLFQHDNALVHKKATI